ncbi:hypothetical protein [Elizabethkingia anophelis]|uniref:Fibrobacter succinogenes major paralogous domain-containing protein n=1 Tax=Elizabethkingia anophelis TaxID=1117645 RepID=A0AAU8UYB3_9FLAO|nr:hypothetical protein [Elizabethkingia anophelis]AQX02829.1 hypothetical protein BBD32_15860 [Elizabethkingia anophelis]OPB56811.1 hypothetical protein BAY11_12320 [Elizabethkingia anophelis]
MKIKKTNIRLVYSLLIGLISALFSLSGCRSSETEHKLSEAIAVIKVNVSSIEFDTSVNLHASILKGSLAGSNIRKSQINFNKDFDLVTEVVPALPESNVKNRTQAILKKEAVSEIKDLTTDIKYKLVIYNNDGSYVTERDYIRGQESATQALNLNGGSTYTFVVYSINSKSMLPPISFNDSNNKTLATSFVGISGNNDFMYYKTDMQVFGDKENNLNIVLKHKLSQVTTTIDASQTGYNITSVAATFSPFINFATMVLADGSTIMGSGTPGSINVMFPTPIDNQIITADPTIINATSTAGSLTIENITVGPLSASNLVAFTDLVFAQGTKYDVKFTLVPKDIALVHEGFAAVRINGDIWLRHNLDSGGDPDIPSQSIAGGYYQFGRKSSVASGTATSTNSNWNGTPAPASAWNSGTEANPIKTANDPCPSKYRVPTRTEIQALIDNTVSSQIGPWSSTNRYSSALVLTSKRNKSIKLTFPTQGWFTYVGLANPPFTPGALNNSGTFVGIWSSLGGSGISYLRSWSSNGAAHIVDTTNNNNKEFSLNVRCIAE